MELHTRKSILTLLVVVTAVGLVIFLASFVPKEAAEAFMRNPAFVFPVWVLTTWGLVRQATSMAAAAPNYSLKRTAAE